MVASSVKDSVGAMLHFTEYFYVPILSVVSKPTHARMTYGISPLCDLRTYRPDGGEANTPLHPGVN